MGWFLMAGPVPDDDPTRHVVTVRRELDGLTSGAGLVVGPDTVLTCARPTRARSGPLPLRLPRFGAGRREMEARLERLRVPLPYSRRLTLLGAYHYSGRSTTTVALGSLLAAVRGEPVLALDGAPWEGALDEFLSNRNPGTVRDLAALPPHPSYDAVRALATPLASGLDVVAHRSRLYGPNPLHAQEYSRALEHTAPYYSFVLTDWTTQRLDASADVVLDRTDQLILCSGTTDWFLDGAARMLGAVREHGRGHLADDAILVTTHVLGSPTGAEVHSGFAQRLGIRPDRIVHVPFDNALRTRHWGLEQLRMATTNAFLELAELVVATGPA